MLKKFNYIILAGAIVMMAAVCSCDEDNAIKNQNADVYTCFFQSASYRQ